MGMNRRTSAANEQVAKAQAEVAAKEAERKAAEAAALEQEAQVKAVAERLAALKAEFGTSRDPLSDDDWK